MKHSKLIFFLGIIVIIISSFVHMSPSLHYSKGKEFPNGNITATPIRLFFAGDAMMDWSVKQAIEKHGPDYPWVHISDFVKQSDYALLNLETAVTNSKEAEDKQFIFKSNPISLIGLKNAGFDLVSLANNHALDYGKKGLEDTFQHLMKTDISYIGAGKNKQEAYSSVSVVLKGKKINFLAFSKVLPSGTWYAGSDSAGIASGYQLENMYKIVEKEKSDADFVIVYIHWGIEKELQFNGEQQNIAHSLIDYGADAVIGSHPHVLQGFEYYKDKPIAYSLGNFLFPDYVSGESAETGIFEIQIKDNKIRSFFYPMFISNNQIHITKEKEQKMRLKKITDRSHNILFNEYEIISSD